MADDCYVNRAPSGVVVFQHDDSFEGLLTAVFDSYSSSPPPKTIVGSQHQQLMGVNYLTVETDFGKAERVIAGIRQKIGGDAYERIWTGFLSCNPDKSDIIYRYIRLGMKLGHSIRNHLTDPRVIDMDKLAKLVGRESGQLIEFVRFSRMEGGVFYAKITPDNDVVPLMMPFFADRFNTRPFIIHDTGRQIAGVYNTHDWVIRSTEGTTLPSFAADEWHYRALWKRFYDTIAIKERINPDLRRQHMPKKFWRNMTEMTLPDASKTTSLPSDLSRYDARKIQNPVAPRLEKE